MKNLLWKCDWKINMEIIVDTRNCNTILGDSIKCCIPIQNRESFALPFLFRTFFPPFAHRKMVPIEMEYDCWMKMSKHPQCEHCVCKWSTKFSCIAHGVGTQQENYHDSRPSADVGAAHTHTHSYTLCLAWHSIRINVNKNEWTNRAKREKKWYSRIHNLRWLECALCVRTLSKWFL